MKIPMHPGEFLRLAFLEPLEVSPTTLAAELNVSKSSISRILNEKSDLSYEMALKLEKRFSRSAESWMDLQTAYGLYKARATM